MIDGYVPDVGHVVWLGSPEDPEAARRPFLILTRRDYNAKTSHAVGVPITTRRKGYPFEVPLGDDGPVPGVALADRLRSIDWRAHRADFALSVSPTTLQLVRGLVATFLELD